MMSKGNEAKSKMKQPSDRTTPRFEHGGALNFHGDLVSAQPV